MHHAEFLGLKRNASAGVALAVIIAAATGAYAHGGHKRRSTRKTSNGEIAMYGLAMPVFERHCFRCHTSKGDQSKPRAIEHLDMDVYPFGGKHAAEATAAIRKVLGVADDSKPTMPADNPGAVSGDDLSKILAWAEAFDRSHQNPKPHPHKSPEPSHAP